jgi:cation diffusion facilitator CzcD-associated flavoprotein CzcO
LPVPGKDTFANVAQKLLGAKRGYALARRKNIVRQRAVYALSQKYPAAARRLIRYLNAKELPEGYPVDTHFNPAYNPWDQRLCVVPDADLFKAISSGAASVVTDRIATFTETGIQLESGEHLDADIIVTATGLNIQLFAGMSLTVDGAVVDPTDCVVYKAMMLSGVPNFAFTFGYTNSSWTLKVGLLCEHFCRLLSHMAAYGYDIARPEAPEMATQPMLDLSAGYVQRALDRLPKQGVGDPWLVQMNYYHDIGQLREGSVINPHLHFGASSQAATRIPAESARV